MRSSCYTLYLHYSVFGKITMHQRHMWVQELHDNSAMYCLKILLIISECKSQKIPHNLGNTINHQTHSQSLFTKTSLGKISLLPMFEVRTSTGVSLQVKLCRQTWISAGDLTCGLQYLTAPVKNEASTCYFKLAAPVFLDRYNLSVIVYMLYIEIYILQLHI